MKQNSEQYTHDAIIWLQQFLQLLEKESDIIDDMPVKDVEQELKAAGVDIKGFHTKLHSMLEQGELRNKPIDLREHLAEEITIIPVEGSGYKLTAAKSSVTLEHSVVTKSGTIDIRYNWGQATGDEPAYIWLSWNVNIVNENSMSIQFIHRDTHEIFYELSLGTIHKGNKTLTSTTLGFDPCQQPWAIVVLELRK